MNLIGKLLVGLIVIMCIVFMGLAMTVYSSHQNWYTQAQTLNKKLEKSNSDLKQASGDRDRVESKLTGELEAIGQQVVKLESERARLEQDNTKIQSEVEQLTQQARDRIAAVTATQQNNDRLAKELAEQRQSVRNNQQARDEGFGVMLDAAEARDQAEGQISLLAEQKQELTRQVARMTKLLRANGIDASTNPDFVMEPTDGLVTAIRRRGATQLIEVTIGSDDGLKTGHTVEVFRGSKYLGRAEIIRIAPDRAIGEVNRRFLQGQIQEGDRVATRLKLS